MTTPRRIPWPETWRCALKRAVKFLLPHGLVLLRQKLKRKPVTAIYGSGELDFSSLPRCLLLAPHPDDDLIGAGGTLIQHAELFDVLCLSSSGGARCGMTPEENAQVRADDFTRIMTELGVRRHRVFVYGNDQNGRSLDFYPGHIDDYSAWMNLDDYGYIFLPHPLDNHPDHRYISVLLRNIAEKQQSKRNFRLAFYEVWSPLPDANVFAAIDAVVELKFRRLSQYRTVGGGYVTPIRGLNSYRALQGSIFQCAYAEAFTIAPAETLWRIPEQTPT